MIIQLHLCHRVVLCLCHQIEAGEREFPFVSPCWAQTCFLGVPNSVCWPQKLYNRVGLAPSFCVTVYLFGWISSNLCSLYATIQYKSKMQVLQLGMRSQEITKTQTFVFKEWDQSIDILIASNTMFC